MGPRGFSHFLSSYHSRGKLGLGKICKGRKNPRGLIDQFTNTVQYSTVSILFNPSSLTHPLIKFDRSYIDNVIIGGTYMVSFVVIEELVNISHNFSTTSSHQCADLF